jgi:hypothetical protein
MIDRLRRAPLVITFAVATAGLSAAAWLQTYLCGLSGWPSIYYDIFDRLFIFTDDWGAAFQVGVVLLVAISPALRNAGAALARALGERPVATAVAAFVVFALGAKIAYHATPFAMDESAQVAQAYAFASGRLSWFQPPDLLDRMIPPGFRNYFYAVNARTGEVASMYWPGFAALMTPFAWAQVPWLVNPLITAATLLVIHAFGTRFLGGREVGGWAMLLALASPEFTVNALSFYSMPAHLLFNLLFAWLLLDGRPSRAFFAGLLGGWALVLHNPAPHALFAAPWLVWLLLDRRRWPALLAVSAGYVPIGIVVGVAWPTFVADVGANAAAASTSAAPASALQTLMRMVSGAFQIPGYPMISARLYATWKLWIWSAPGLLILAIAGARIIKGPVLLLGASAILTYVIYWFVPLDQGHGWGYRYFHPAWAALPLFAAAFIVSRPTAMTANSDWRGWVGGIALAGAVCSTSLRFWQVDDIIGRHLAQRIPVTASGRWVVFVGLNPGLYTWDMIQNMPGQDDRLVLMSQGPAPDVGLMAVRFPSAQRVLADRRGTLWKLSP